MYSPPCRAGAVRGIPYERNQLCAGLSEHHNNDLMACEKDADAACTVFGQGHERLVRKAASGKVYFQPDRYGSILSVSFGQGQPHPELITCQKSLAVRMRTEEAEP